MINKRIALTGGPCAGKSSAMNYLKKELEKNGIKVIVVPEAATQVINEGNTPGTVAFQFKVFQRQLELERKANLEALSYDRVVVFYDRSLYDQMAYISEETFKEFLKLTETKNVSERYDGIIHLVSASIGTNAYTTTNNAARMETKEEAMELEYKTLKASQRYKGLLQVVDNSTDFNGKLKRVLEAAIKVINQW